MIKKLLIATGVAAIVAVGGSLIQPFGAPRAPGTSQDILRETQIDPETIAIVQRACQNCHSENTAWPWYSNIAPVSWLLAHDVQEARSNMNLSHWQDYSTDDRLRLLSAIGSAVRNREMPLHPKTHGGSAALTYYIFEGILAGIVNDTTYAISALTGGGGSTKTRPARV